ncbi:Eco57I restriction-modification methylase domain-containing protein [Amycolatopsis vancoresmycina]|uniref:site-specific DNA-methyltransferase (adenine-specific) n=1 Tax=Amycolatopsis vancoresmycina DSM 44592 TaxID=1292037 RepID=R1I545_9PSEU|nr:DNA methyltransferase [Amycolatopsis vancoresmycina]EOD67656.1 type II DNA modification enzyme [Amycolatopsis vancoresmycina DSM 44592]
MSRVPFPSLRVAGGLLPADLFARTMDDASLAGRSPADYGLGARRTVREAASRAFEDLTKEWRALSRDKNRGTRDWLRAVFGNDGLGYGPLEELRGGLTVGDKQFKVSHRWQHVPVHWLPWGTDLDHRTKGVAGAADAAPQSMLQELLNRTDDHLYAMVSNGQRLRLLRDSRSLAGSAYVEFDLELIFDEGMFPDFLLLYRLLHATRFAVRAGESPSSCWLETWRTTAIQQGERALERLRGGVEQAINTLGTGFARHPANGALNRRLASGELLAEDYKRSVLRLVYRLLFWFVAEDRNVLLDPAAPQEVRKRYDTYFSARRLRDRARRGSTDQHEDLWESVHLVFVGLGLEQGRPELGVPGIGGIFARITRDGDTAIEPSRPDELDEPLEGMRLTNEALITAVRHLAIVDSAGQRRQVDFLNLDSEELGSVYESLLELHPAYDPDEQVFGLTAAAGNERKTTGSYYTPSSLTEALLDSALDPVLDDAVQGIDAADAQVEALLNVTVCDPACGSGHFLVAAARRIARRVAQLRSGENEPSPKLVRHAMREVVSRCVYGVDINETAAELAKVSLWLEAVEPGFPLPFLDANIRVGNSLLGTTPALIDKGIPKEAFKALIGDDKDAVRAIVKRNAEQAEGIFDLFASDGPLIVNTEIAEHTRELVRTDARSLTDVYVQRARLRDIDGERLSAKRVADAWCSAFVQPKTKETALQAVVQSTLDWIKGDPDTLERAHTASMVEKLARDYRFFHWHVEFPHIFAVLETGSNVNGSTGWQGGFSCVLGNPPWERIKLQEQEFFASRRPEIATAKNAAARKKMIAALATSDEVYNQRLHEEFAAELRLSDGWSHLLRESGRYPLTGRGDINTYAVFAETGRTILAPRARVGMVLPTGIATDATTQYFFKDLIKTRTLASIYDFENEEKIFQTVTNKFRFCLWTGSGQSTPLSEINLAFRVRQASQILDRRFVFTQEDIDLLNPNTGTCPVFDYRRNAEITLAMYRHINSVLWREEPEDNPWRLSFQAMFHMANDANLFHDRETLEHEGWKLAGNLFERDGQRMLPLHEAKMVHHFDHRFSTYEGASQAQLNKGTLPRTTAEQKDDPNFAVLARYWVAESEVDARLARKDWNKDWLLGWRDITTTANERTLICSAIPRAAIAHTNPIVISKEPRVTPLYANLCSFSLDYITRQKMGGTHLTYGYLNQLAVLPPRTYDEVCDWASSQATGGWITDRVIELAYTTYDMTGFARDHGDEGPPFRWDEERRFWLRAELDAAYFHLYGVPHDDVDYIMDTFRAFRNNDPERFARTKQAILDIYDDMAKAIETREPYQTRLDPPPGQGPRHPERTDSGTVDHG